MARYLYIAAYREQDDEALSFRHVALDASDDQDAYEKGMDAIKARGHEPVEFENDYVVDLGALPAPPLRVVK